MDQFPRAPEYTIRAISNFYEIAYELPILGKDGLNTFSVSRLVLLTPKLAIAGLAFFFTIHGKNTSTC
jgi:hypothetical protein